ncbi:plasmid pRiA4b ORF-3 family protein [Microscilla marina]|uniref:YgfB and YecA n=1 Tax=Microscilla marina ATCC 23134 TaxID=313606 RepID=A1ZT29_MICM2|nr:plasmid pRiA4b ORF-3 family protein [Microscilla marina]EAY26419.1 YgfB and YecA [Microscilla marina ATCC 23134]
MSTNNKIYQLKVTLMDVTPVIWRKIQVPQDILLPDLHKVIQTAMGWKNSHLHQFEHKRNFYAAPTPWGEMESEDYRDVKLGQLLKKENDKLIYTYDFGDSWQHNVVLEEVHPPTEGGTYPVCVSGKNACPPEDCGGPWGYMDLMMIMKNPKHPEHKEMKDWLGGDLYSSKFDKKAINKQLAMKDYGILTFDVEFQ